MIDRKTIFCVGRQESTGRHRSAASEDDITEMKESIKKLDGEMQQMFDSKHKNNNLGVDAYRAIHAN